jgi:predicted transposase YdaD
MPRSSHDRLFRKGLSLPRAARQCLEAWLPDSLLRHLDWNSLRTEKVPGLNAGLRESIEDVLYSVQLGERQILIYVLLEHVTRPEWTLPLQIQERILLVWRHHVTRHPETRQLPLLIPLVVHTSAGKWKIARRLRELIEIPSGLQDWAAEFIPDGYLLVELSRRGREKLAQGALGRAILLALTRQRKGKLEAQDLVDIVGELLREEDHEAVKALARHLWTYLVEHSELREEEMEHIVEEIEQAPATDETLRQNLRKTAMSTKEMLIQKGREEGREEGLQKGLQKGLTHGEWIGKIQLLEQLMGETQTTRVALEKKTIKQLSAQFAKLEAAYHREHRK